LPGAVAFRIVAGDATMHPFLRKILGFNWVLLGLMLALMVFGIYAIYSATWMRDNSFWRDQIKWAFICLPTFFAVSLIDYRWVRWGALPLYIAGLAGLVATMLFGETRYGAKSWLDLKFMNFQPSQLAILAGILMLALFLSEFKRLHPFLRIMSCGVIVGAPWILILIQPDLGSALVWIPVVLGMLFIAQIPLRYLISILLLGVAAVPIVVNFGLKPYQHDRIMVFLHPELDPQNTGWTINQSLIAIGSGGMAGKGFKAENTQNALGFLPSTIVHNDFIFAVLGEQHGFIGGVILLGAFALLLLTALYVVLFAGDDLGRLLAAGVVMLLFAHVFMNVGMTVSVTPITGLPLPLVSYGGSFLLIVMVSFGLLQSVWIHRRIAK
jgi:rod shape determining protein RodA